MIDGGKKRKSDFRTIVAETYKDFAENTSIQGLKYTVQSGIKLYERIFWSLVVLCCLSGAIYLTFLFWGRYNSNPTLTSTQTAYAPLTSVPFPAITICDISHIVFAKVDEFVEKLNIADNEVEIVRRALPQLRAFYINPAVRVDDYNISDLRILEKVLINNEFSDVRVITSKLTTNCRDMFIKCRWAFQDVDCNTIFEPSFAVDGHCCSFNYIIPSDHKAEPRHNPYTGFNSGLIVFLKPGIAESRYNTPGIKVITHSPYEYPGSGSAYKFVAAGRQSYLQVAASKLVCSEDVRRLSMKQRQCAFPDEVQLKYFPYYEATNCMIECDANKILNKCGCIPYYYPDVKKDFPICNITTIPCLPKSNGSEETALNESDDQNCHCPSQCESLFYNVITTAMTFSEGREKFYSSSFLDGMNVTEDTILLHVYFLGDTQTILLKDTITSEIYLLSSFGGVYSLFLGCSFITLVEILYYCSFRSIVNMKILGRIDRKPAQMKKTKKKTKKRKHSKRNIALFGPDNVRSNIHSPNSYSNMFIN